MGSCGSSGKTWWRAAGAALALVLLAWQVPLQSQPAAREANVRLEWRTGWTQTGITVAPGDTLSIRARTVGGSVADAPRPVPNPATGRSTDVPQRRQGGRDSLAGSLFKTAARQVIMARIGDGGPFVVGRRYRQAVKAGGPVSLRWNVPREMAAAARGFDVSIRVDPAPPVGERQDSPDAVAPVVPPRPPRPPQPANPRDPVAEEPMANAVGPPDPIPDERPAAENGSVAEPAADPDDLSAPEQNLAPTAGPDPSAALPREAVEIEVRETVAEDGPATWSPARVATIGGGLAALLLVLAAAAIAVQRARRRKLVNRTRSLLALSPSLDLGDGACRGGSLPADGPAASLRSRLEEGAMRCGEGGEDG
jgi:hypothetical protein